jgi:hypothetical protein
MKFYENQLMEVTLFHMDRQTDRRLAEKWMDRQMGITRLRVDFC